MLISKILLVLLLSLIIFHIIFNSSKTFSSRVQNEYENIDLSISEVSTEVYYNYLNSFDSGFTTRIFLQNTKVNYLFGLPEKLSYLIYFGYFLIALALIFNNKSNLLFMNSKNIPSSNISILFILIATLTITLYNARNDKEPYDFATNHIHLTKIHEEIDDVESHVEDVDGQVQDIDSRLSDLE